MVPSKYFLQSTPIKVEPNEGLTDAHKGRLAAAVEMLLDLALGERFIAGLADEGDHFEGISFEN